VGSGVERASLSVRPAKFIRKLPSIPAAFDGENLGVSGHSEEPPVSTVVVKTVDGANLRANLLVVLGRLFSGMSCSWKCLEAVLLTASCVGWICRKADSFGRSMRTPLACLGGGKWTRF